MKRLDYYWCKLRVMALLVLGRERAALTNFNAMLRRWPDDTYALASRAHLLAQAGQLESALADSRRLTLLRAEHATTWFNHGFMLEASGQWDELDGVENCQHGIGLPAHRCHRASAATWR